MQGDPLSDVLTSVRLRGAIFYYVSCDDHWVADTPPSPELADALSRLWAEEPADIPAEVANLTRIRPPKQHRSAVETAAATERGVGLQDVVTVH